MKKIGVILSILTVLTLSFITKNNVSAVSDVTFTINSSNNTSSILCSNTNSSLPSDWSVTYTLTNTNPYATGITPEGTLDVVANGTYDVTNYASVDVQVEESSFIVQLFSQGFWGVATAIVTIIVPIIALFLVFRLVHDLLWGRG